MPIKITKSLFVSTLLFFLVGCFPHIDPRWGQLKKADRVTPQIQSKACELAKKRTDELKSLRTLADISLNTVADYQGLRFTMVFQSPRQIRFELLPPSAALALYLASSDEGRTVLLEPTQRKATNIKDPQELMARMLKVRMMPQDFAYILSARIPPRYLDKICPNSVTTKNDSSVQFFYSTDGPGVTAFDQDTGQYWTIYMKTGLLRTALFRRVRDEWPVLAADFEEDDFSDPNQPFPRKTNLVLGNQVLSANLEYNVVRFNTSVPQTLFNLAVPPGYKLENK